LFQKCQSWVARITKETCDVATDMGSLTPSLRGLPPTPGTLCVGGEGGVSGCRGQQVLLPPCVHTDHSDEEGSHLLQLNLVTHRCSPGPILSIP
jgi:hypothetical protein